MHTLDCCPHCQALIERTSRACPCGAGAPRAAGGTDALTTTALMLDALRAPLERLRGAPATSPCTSTPPQPSQPPQPPQPPERAQQPAPA